MIQIFKNGFLINVLVFQLLSHHFSPQLKTKHTKFFSTSYGFKPLSSFPAMTRDASLGEPNFIKQPI